MLTQIDARGTSSSGTEVHGPAIAGSYPLPSNMVAGGVHDTSLTNHHYATPQNAQPLTIAPLPKWHVRNGRNQAYLKWYDALMTAEADLDFKCDQPKPSFQALPQSIIEQAANEGELHMLIDTVDAAADEWQHKTNILFALIKSSLMLDGIHLESDLRKINSFVNGKDKDARALRDWAGASTPCTDYVATRGN